MLRCSALILVLFSTALSAQLMKPGKWRGNISYSNVDVPFTFEVSYPDGETPQFIFLNGRERRLIKDVTIEADSVFFVLTPFDVEVRAAYTGMTMSGSYIKHYRGDTYPFSASFGMPRMMKKSVRNSPRLEEKWAMVFDAGTPNESEGVGVFKKIGEMVTGTVITKTSDFRYFEGIMDGDSIKLSCFDGAHAFLLNGKKEGGRWTGQLVFDDGYSEAWTGKPDPNASIEDPFEIVKIEKGVHKPYYDLLAAGSGKGTIDPAAYEGKVLVIQLFGTWCPNSHDQTKYLVDWYDKNRELDVAILASSYEANYSQEYGLERIETYKEANSIPYDVVLGGRLSKSGAALPFPFMDRIEAFPTLVILDKQGYARYVHSYFNGPATGSYYDQFDQRFNKIISELVSE